MEVSTIKNTGYDNLIASLKSGQIGNFYVFYGEERYLLERSLINLRVLLCPTVSMVLTTDALRVRGF